MNTAELLDGLKRFDTPSITNVVATYPNDTEHCLGLYDPWSINWYTDQSLKCMYPELGRTIGYAVTAVYGVPSPEFSRLGFADLLRAIDRSPKPVVVCIKQDFPEHLKMKNGLSGGNMTTAMKSLGTVAVISDGPSRDIDEIRPMGVQYMLTGVTAGHGAFGVKAVGVPVSICGMDVGMGDVIHMDENGAVKFPADQLQNVYKKAVKLSEVETARMERISATSDVEEIIRVLGGFEEHDSIAQEGAE